MKPIRIRNLHIRRRSLPQVLASVIFLMPFLLAVLIDFLGLPSAIKYSIDVAWIGLLILTIVKRRIQFDRKLLPLVLVVIGFFAYTLLIYCFRFQSPAYYLWGFRNNFRFYIAFFAFLTYFDEEEVNSLFRLIDVLFWVNAAVSAVQYFILGYQQDYLGGLFGVETGCNAYTIIFYSVVLIKSILGMMNGTETMSACLIRCMVALGFSALAELKVFFLLFVMILVVTAVLTKFSWKKCLLFIAAGAFVSCGSLILSELFGSSSNLSLERILELIFAPSYSSTSDLGRLTAIPIISETILTDPISRLFGLGLGNCDTASFAICNTPFYQNHSQLHYTWFSSAFLFLETGFLGLIMYLSFFVIVFISAVRQMRKGSGNLLHCQMAVVISAVCIALTFYNSSLRMEVGYIAYFALSLPFVGRKKQGK